eukprot:COSAG01_NODE_34141_length_552_cov_2.791091_1_plen_44_part_10
MYPVPHGLQDLAGHGVLHIESLAQECGLVKLLSRLQLFQRARGS